MRPETPDSLPMDPNIKTILRLVVVLAIAFLGVGIWMGLRQAKINRSTIYEALYHNVERHLPETAAILKNGDAVGAEKTESAIYDVLTNPQTGVHPIEKNFVRVAHVNDHWECTLQTPVKPIVFDASGIHGAP